MARRSNRKPGSPIDIDFPVGVDGLPSPDFLVKLPPEMGRDAAQAIESLEKLQRQWETMFSSGQLKELSEELDRWAATAQERERNVRQSAAYAVRETHRVLAAHAEEEEGVPFHAGIDAVRWALEVEKEAGDALAAEVLDRAGKLLDRSIELLESGQWDLHYSGRFVGRLRGHVAAMREHVGMGDDAALPKNEDGAMRAADVDGDPLLWLDEAFAGYLESMGEACTEMAAEVRKAARKRWAKRGQGTIDDEPENGLLLKSWINLGADDRADLYPYLQWLAIAVWRAEVRPELTAPEFAPSVVVVGGEDYTKLPKPTAAISWGFGGAGVAVDDDRFTAQPDAPRVQVVPKSWSIVQGEDLQCQPHQTTLPLEIPGDTPLTLAMGGQPGTVIPSPGGKLLVLMLATAHGGDMTKGPLGELARYIYPGRRVQRSNLEQIAKVLNIADKLCAVLPDGTALRCFDVRWPAVGVDPEQVVGWGLGRFFLDMARRATATAHGLRALRGEFVVNLTGIMRLPRRDALLRNYIQAAALWNDANTPGKPGDFNADYLKRYTVDRWAALVNTLSTAGVARDRRKLWRDKRDTLKDLEVLHDRGMIRIERAGKKGEITLLPPDDLLEARRLIRGGAARPKKPKK